MNNTDWYSGEDWYAPLISAETKAQPVPIKKEKKKKTGLRAAGAAAVLLVLIVATSLAFGSGSSSTVEADTATMPDDWHSYLDDFYTSVTTDIAQIEIERTEYSGVFEVLTEEPKNEELSLKQLFSVCSPSVVAISGYTEGEKGYNWGTGVIISSDGLVVTNTHVIDTCTSAVVTLSDDSEYEARLIGADSISDIALLKIDAENLPAAQFGKVENIGVGDKVAAIGNPLGETFRLTLTDGIISAIDRGMSYNGHTMTLIQTNTAINEGNSGGPLFNMYGQVIGITNMKMMSAFSSIEGIGFAIPSNTVKTVVAQLIQNGEVRGRPALGVTVGTVPQTAKTMYDLPEGLYVSEVQPKSDAAAKGVMVGDIITAVNGTPVTTTEEVAAIKNTMSVGESLELSIWRDGETIAITVTLVETNDLYK